MSSLNDYQIEAERTRNYGDPKGEIANYALGLTGEAGEVADIVKKAVFHGHSLDISEIEKELGDVLWYIANIANVLELDLNTIASKNIQKLEKRYPKGFDKNKSINRTE